MPAAGTRRQLANPVLVGNRAIEIAEFKQYREEGTEAAAATAVVMFPTAAPRPERPPEPEPFHIDHPFLFFIADRTTGAVLFAGRIIDPR